jgi:hypothetical protein
MFSEKGVILLLVITYFYTYPESRQAYLLYGVQVLP